MANLLYAVKALIGDLCPVAFMLALIRDGRVLIRLGGRCEWIR